MSQLPARKITLAEFLQQPETKPASEYIDGQIIQQRQPKVEHSAIAHSVIQTDLATAINSVLKPGQQGRGFIGLSCTVAGHSIVPDITVLPWADIPRREDGKVSGELLAAPHWMIEILSPGQSQTKVVKKILHALEHGTQLGWLIDPAEDCVFGYTPDLRTVLYEKPEAQLPVPAFAAGFRLTVGEWVAWLYE